MSGFIRGISWRVESARHLFLRCGKAQGKIAAIGRLKDAKATRTIDADGLVVAPGFVDMMEQTARPLISEGMQFVLVNGKLVIENGKFTGATPGKVLRGPGYRAK